MAQSPNPAHKEAIGRLQSLLAEASQNLDNDQKLSDSMGKANDVLLPILFELGEPQGNPDQELPDYILRNGLTNLKFYEDSSSLPLLSQGVLLPIEPLYDVEPVIRPAEDEYAFANRPGRRSFSYPWCSG